MAQGAKELAALIASLGETARFCVSGVLEAMLPGLAVKGVGPISLPIQPSVARRLVGVAERAPYGRGAETLVDTDVRRVWQVEPRNFSVTNPAWKQLVDGAVETVKHALGIRASVRAELYKLLIYEKGSFFTPHRDSEQADGMFATLVIGLPSGHTGGELLVRHEGETNTVHFGGARSAHDIQYAAFYTDCVHEIKPVTRGYRVCLVYNLLMTGRRKLSAPRIGQATSRAQDLLQRHFANTAHLRMAVPLAHDYTQKGLAPALLKGTDRGLVAILLAAAHNLGYRARLGLLSLHQSGEADWEGAGYYGGYYDDEDEDPGLDDAGMGEVFEERLEVNHLVDQQGKPAHPRRLDIDPEELFIAGDLDDLPWEKEVTEASGNAGVTVDRWYRSGVLLIWPPERENELLCREGQSAALPALSRLVRSARTDADRTACRAFAARLLDSWQHHAPGAARMLDLIASLGDASLATHTIEEVIAPSPCGDEGPALVRIARELDWDVATDGVAHVLAHQQPRAWQSSLAPAAVLVEALCLAARSDPRAAPACRELAALFAERLCTWDDGRHPPDPNDPEPADANADRARVIVALVRSLDAVGEHPLLDAVLAFIISDTAHWPLSSALAPAAIALRDSTGSATPTTRLREHCIAALTARVSTPPAPPLDWRLDPQLRCRCRDCLSVNTFLQDPALQTLRLPLSKERRKHLHRALDATRLLVTHTTDRRTSPNTLVLTKTRLAYQRRLRQHAHEAALLDQLKSNKPAPQPRARRRA